MTYLLLYSKSDECVFKLRFRSPHFHTQSKRSPLPWKNVCKLASGVKQDIQRNVCVPEDRGEKALASKKHGKLGKDYPLRNVHATSLASNPYGILP